MHAKGTSEIATLAHVDRNIAILRLPMGGSCAIPLGVTVPSAVELLTWAFVDFTHRSTANPTVNPACLVVLGCPDGSCPGPGGIVGLRTHIRDQHLTLAEHPVPLSPGEISILARGVLAALAPANAQRFAVLLPLLAPGLDAVGADPGAVELSAPGGTGTWVATGLDFIPSHLLARVASGYVCGSIDTVRVRAGARTAMVLTSTLSRDAPGPDRVILAGSGRHAVAQIARAA